VLSSGPLTGIVVEATATEEQIQAILGALDPANVSTRDQGESARDRAIGASLERLDHALKQLLQSRR
jgi:flagellin-like hook-associated protein FlgL